MCWESEVNNATLVPAQKACHSSGENTGAPESAYAISHGNEGFEEEIRP